MYQYDTINKNGEIKPTVPKFCTDDKSTNKS